ncbi:hypothetical protein J1N35_001799, partial [Gossypium stocksii]
RCCAHILNLIVKAGLELADDVVGKIRNGIKYINKSGIRRKRFYDVANKSFHLNVTKKLRQDVGVWKIHKVLLDIVKGPYSFLTPMVKQMQEKFNKNYAEYSLILSCAVILDPRYKLNYVQYCFTTIYNIHASDFIETILSNLRLLLDEYAKKSKFTSSSLAENSNVSDKDPVDSSFYQHNVNSVDFGEDFYENDDYKRYLNESSTKSEKSQLDIYLEEPELKLNSQIDVLKVQSDIMSFHYWLVIFWQFQY